MTSTQAAIAFSTKRSCRAWTPRAAEVILLVNDEGKVLYVSPSSVHLGFFPHDLIGKTMLDLIHPDDRLRSRRALIRALAQPSSPRQVEVRVLRRDGSWCWVESTISNLLNEPRIGAIVINCRDIVGEKEARELQKRQIEDLVRCNDQLEYCADSVAHDFREPLRTISMFTSLLAESKLDEEGQELAQFILDGVTRMSALFDGLHALALSRVDDPPLPFDLNHVVADALKDLTHVMTSSGAIITVDPLPFVQGNEQHLARVFQNLIVNAIKYRSRRPIQIHITAERFGPDWIIKVQDNGLGIASEHYERIFLLLKRIGGREIPGAGIGLAICKKVIEEMGGRIWVESKLGEGSVFCFTIAAAKKNDLDVAIPPDRTKSKRVEAFLERSRAECNGK